MVKIVRLVWDMLNFRFPAKKSWRKWLSEIGSGLQKLHLKLGLTFGIYGEGRR